MSTYRVDRTLLLEHDPAKTGGPPLESLRQVDWRHQKAAMAAGYNSVTEMAVDELVRLVRETQARLDRLEEQLRGLQQMTLTELEP